MAATGVFEIAPSTDMEVLKDFYSAIGEALVMWQRVEESHFRLYLELIRAEDKEVAAIPYFSIESFNGRHKMVGHMISVALGAKNQKKLRIRWSNELQKTIKDANLDRNKLAHYGLQISAQDSGILPDGTLSLTLSEPRFQPSPLNIVSKLQGYISEQETHNLNAAAIRTYGASFYSLRLSILEYSDLVRWSLHPTSE
jgi:hypothetical protein